MGSNAPVALPLEGYFAPGCGLICIAVGTEPDSNWTRVGRVFVRGGKLIFGMVPITRVADPFAPAPALPTPVPPAPVLLETPPPKRPCVVTEPSVPVPPGTTPAPVVSTGVPPTDLKSREIVDGLLSQFANDFRRAAVGTIVRWIHTQPKLDSPAAGYIRIAIPLDRHDIWDHVLTMAMKTTNKPGRAIEWVKRGDGWVDFRTYLFTYSAGIMNAFPCPPRDAAK